MAPMPRQAAPDESPPMTSAEAWLIKFCQAPFGLVIPVLLAIIFGMIYGFHKFG